MDQINSTGIPAREYSKDYDCDNFAIDLSAQAMKEGRLIGIAILFGDWESGHMVNFSIIDNWIVRIEPQSGEVSKYWTDEYRSYLLD